MICKNDRRAAGAACKLDQYRRDAERIFAEIPRKGSPMLSRGFP